MDVKAIKNYVDYVNLLAFDYITPDRNPKEADHPAPIFSLNGRRAFENGNYLVNEW